MKFIDFLNEEIFKGEFYLFYGIKIQKPRITTEYIYDENGKNSIEGNWLTIHKNGLSQYKKALHLNSASTSVYNFIYSINNLRLIDCKNERDIKNAIKLNAIKGNFNWDEWKIARDKSSYIRKGDNLVSNGFFKNFDGILGDVSGDALLYITNDFDFARFKLIDGNALRFNTNKEENIFLFPDDVKKELLRYTDDPKKKLNVNVKKWLKENFKKSYKNKKLYRTIGVQFDDFGKYDNVTIESIEAILKKWLGLKKVTDIKLKDFVKLKRGKESSWSTSPVVARNFASGIAEKSINFLFESIISADQIIVDFNELSADAKKDFRFYQNEVIVDSGIIESKIIGIWAEKEFIEWLNNNNFDFKANIGIFKK